MALSAAELQILIKARDDASAVLDKVKGSAGGLASGLGTALKVGALGAAAGIGVAAFALKDFVGQAAEAQRVQAQTNAVLESTKGVAGVTAESVSELANSLSRIIPIDDEVIQSAQNMLLTFTNIGKDVFPQATEAVLNMSVALGQDAQSSAIQLGKALNDPIAGVTALQRVGVKLTDAQRDQIAAFVESGDIMSAQKVILQELETEFGNSARAAGDTFAGKMAILNTQIGNVKETIGAALLPMLTRAAKALGDFLAEHQDDIQRLAELFSEKLAKAVEGVVDFFDRHRGTIAGFFDTFKAGLRAMQPVVEFILGNKVALIAAITAIGAAIAVALGPVSLAAVAITGIILLVGLLAKHWDEIKAKTIEIWNAIKTFLAAKWREIVSIAALILLGPAGLLVLFTTNAFGIRDKVTEAFTSMVAAIRAILGEAKAAATAVADAIGDAFRSLPGLLFTLGQNIVRSLWEGILSLKDFIIGQVTALAHAILDAVKRGLGALNPFSPSVFGIEVGRGLGEGIVAGIEQSLPEIEAAAALIPEVIAAQLGGLREVISSAFGTLSTIGGTTTMEDAQLQADLLRLQLKELDAIAAAEEARAERLEQIADLEARIAARESVQLSIIEQMEEAREARRTELQGELDNLEDRLAASRSIHQQILEQMEEALAAAREAGTRRIADAEERLAAVRKDATEKIRAAESRLGDLRRELASIQEALAPTRTVADIAAELARATEAGHIGMAALARSELEARGATVPALEEEIAALEGVVSAEQARIDAAEAEAEAVRAAVAAELDAMEARIDAWREAFAQQERLLQEQIDAKKQQMEDELAAIDAVIAARKEAWELEKAQLEAQLAALEAMVSPEEQHLQAIRDSIDALQDVIARRRIERELLVLQLQLANELLPTDAELLEQMEQQIALAQELTAVWDRLHAGIFDVRDALLLLQAGLPDLAAAILAVVAGLLQIPPGGAVSGTAGLLPAGTPAPGFAQTVYVQQLVVQGDPTETLRALGQSL